MTRILLAISSLCILALTACGVAVMLEARALIKDVRGDVTGIDRETVDTLLLVKKAAGNANDASSEAAAAAQEQRTYWNKTSLETYKTAAAARLLIVRTNRSLNNTLTPELRSAIGDIRVDLEELRQNLVETKNATVKFQQVLADADGVIADPKIKEILANLASATASLDASIKQLDAMLVSGTATAEDVRKVADKVAEQYTKARNLYYALFKELVNIGGNMGQMIK